MLLKILVFYMSSVIAKFQWFHFNNILYELQNSCELFSQNEYFWHSIHLICFEFFFPNWNRYFEFGQYSIFILPIYYSHIHKVRNCWCWIHMLNLYMCAVSRIQCSLSSSAAMSLKHEWNKIHVKEIQRFPSWIQHTHVIRTVIKSWRL